MRSAYLQSGAKGKSDRMNVKLAFPILIVFFLLAVNVNAYSYEIPYYIRQNGSSPLDIYGLSFKTDNQCTITLRDYSTLTGSNYDIDLAFYSPDNITLATGSLENQGNHSCKFIGTASETTSLDGYYEGRSDIIHTGTGGYVTLTNRYQCEESGYYFDIYVEPEKHNDSFINVPNRFGITASPPSYVSNATILTLANYTVYDHCFSYMAVNPFLSQTGTASASGSYDRTVVTYYPFNTTTGTVHYRFDLGDASRSSVYCLEACVGTNFIADATLWLYDVRAGTYNVLHHSQVDCENTFRISGNWSGILHLDENIEYMFIFAGRYDDDGAVFPCSRTWQLYEPFVFNMSIYVYLADWDCGAWSVCDGTIQTRTCIDLNGISPDRIEYRTCALGVVENATLGFEEYETVNDVLKCIPQWLFYYCLYNIENISVDRPLNWTILDPSYGKANFLRMTQEYATEGTRSLKMWQIPPKPGEVLTNATCGNLTTSFIPQLYQGVSNTSFSVSYNVTFPAENMQIGFDTKKCSSQEVQHTSLTGWFNLSLCDELCYADSCDTEPRGRYVFNVQDVSAGTSVFGSPQYMDATTQTDSPLFDISGLGIEAGKTYNIVFALSHENPNDATGNCVYIDNVHYQVTEEPISDFVGTECNSRCIGTTRYEATKTQAGSCFIVIRGFSPLCMDEETAGKVENNENFCSDSITLQSFNEKTGKYEAIECENTCVDDRCLTEEDVEISVILASLYAPHELIQLILIEWNLPLEDYGIVWFFNSIFMYVNYLAIGLGIGVSLVVKGNSKEAKDLYIPFIVTIMVILVASTFGGFYPLEVGIPIIVFIGIILWKTSERIVGGHGGG